MKEASHTCPNCGAAITSESPHGLCPRCLLAGVVHGTQPGGASGAGTLPPAPAIDAVREAFPQLEVLELVGRGGMGVVYKARQKSLNRLVALKLLAPERVTGEEFSARFGREAMALARLSHPNIVTIHDFGQAGGFYFLLMEFVDGVNLRQAMNAGRFTPEQALAIVPPVCEALQYAHERGVVHRDIKPENLLLDRDGRVKIADFGIAKMLGSDAGTPACEGEPSRTGVSASLAAGTPHYMAPEQTEQRATDHRADIYSLGVVLYEMLTGELPADKLQPPSRKVQIDVRLDEIVLRALETRPELRFQTAGEMRTQVETISAAPRAPSGPGPAASAPPRPPKIGTATLTTPGELASFSGQFFCYRTRGQLVLDDRQLTHSCRGVATVIPLSAIRDVSIGQYPRSMNPVGITLLSVTYETNGQRQQVLLSPMEGWFAFPDTWDALVADWHAAIREAVRAATGTLPASTPDDRLGVPRGFPWTMFAMVAVPLLFSAGLLTFIFRQAGASSGSSSRMLPLIFFAMLVALLAPMGMAWLLNRRRASRPPSLPDDRAGTRNRALMSVAGPVLFVAILLVARLAAQDAGHEQSAVIGIPELVIWAVVVGVALMAWHQRRKQPATPEPGRGWRSLGTILLCLGMFIGGLKIQDVSREHVQRVHAMAATIPPLQQQWIAAGNEVFAANTELSRLIVHEPLARTEAERQRHAIEQGRLEGEVSKAKVRQDVILGQMQTTQTRLTATPFPFREAAARVLPWSLPFVLPGVLLLGWPRRSTVPGGRRSWTSAVLLLLLIPVLLFGAFLVQFTARVASPSGVTHFESALVGVSNNVVMVDVTAELAGANAELRTLLEGPALSRETETAVADAFFPPFNGTFVKPTPQAGNASWRILSPGRQTVRLGFVLPDAALAQQAAFLIRLIGPLSAVPDPNFVVTLFRVPQTNGEVYQASLRLGPPRTAADPGWVSLSGQFMENETTFHLTWEILASRPGTARFRREGNLASSSLNLDPKTKLHRATASLELSRVSTNRVHLVIKKGYATSTEELTGNFRELADELRLSKTLSAKTVTGVTTELCRVKDQPLTVQVDVDDTRPAATGNTFHFARSSRVTFGFIVMGAIVIVGLGGMALLVWLLRKSGASSRVVLLVFGIPFLLLAVGGAAAIAWMWAPNGMRLEKFARMQLICDYPSHGDGHPPGRVQQTQNGFRLQLPPGQLATFELLIRQADDSLQPVSSLSALVAVGTNGSAFNDRLYWTLRRGDGPETTNELWFWTVTAHDGSGRALPQLVDHGTNFTHALASGETLDWWQLALPGSLTFGAGEEKMLPLFRTTGSATASGTHPKEGILRVRCAALPTDFVTNGSPHIELGLAAHALISNLWNSAAPSFPTSGKRPPLVSVEREQTTQTIPLELERRLSSAKPAWMWLKGGDDKPIGQQLLLDSSDGLYHGGILIRLEKSEQHQVGPETRARLGYGFACMSTPWATVTSARAFEDGAALFRQQVARLDRAPLSVPPDGDFVELMRIDDAAVSVALTDDAQAGLPRFKARITCFNGPVDSRSSCSSTTFQPDGTMHAKGGPMKCGYPGRVSEIEWSLVGRRGTSDVYRFTRRFPADAPDAVTTSKEVAFSDGRVVVFEDTFQTIVMEPPKK